jgi:hypothetical protein
VHDKEKESESERERERERENENNSERLLINYSELQTCCPQKVKRVPEFERSDMFAIRCIIIKK